MRVLYAIQGTGNGHISRARDIIPELQKHCDLDILISGIQADVQLGFPVNYQFKGMSFIFGKHGGVDVWNTYIQTNLLRIQNEMRRVPVKEYDFVINDFEPISAWACYLKGVPCLALGHQAALLQHNVPKPKKIDAFGAFILRNYAPSLQKIGFHFQAYSENVYTPVIRQQIRELRIDERGHYTVYLPAYDHAKLIKKLNRFGDVKWDIFSKHTKVEEKSGNVTIMPITNEKFVHSLATSSGVLSGAGFEVPAEALYLQKKLVVVPMKNQHEQQFNAAALKKLGVPVLNNLKRKSLHVIDNWLNSDERIQVEYPQQTAQIIKTLFEPDIQQKLLKISWRQKFKLYFKPQATDESDDFQLEL